MEIKGKRKSFYFYFHSNKILLKSSWGKTGIVSVDDFMQSVPDSPDLIETSGWLEFFKGEKATCYTAMSEEAPEIPDFYIFVPVRTILAIAGKEVSQIISKGSGLAFWNQTTRFCGKCGSSTSKFLSENGKKCVECGALYYPRIAPAIIVRIEKGNSILLARDARFSSDLYSNIAGFVDPGECLEQTVIREIQEEVGIKVMDIKYFGSQHWPISQSLMVAFTANYESGEICPDGKEILTAGWFNKDSLPRIPEPGSISYTLINDFFKEKHPEE